MTIIELLNKIANGEEVPKKIKYDAILFTFNEKDKTYKNCNSDLSEFMVFDAYSLTDTVEILEEENKIENIITFYDNDIEEYVAETKINNIKVKEHYGSPFEQMIIEKIKELIDEINKLKEK